MIRSHRCFCVMCLAIGLALAMMLFFGPLPAVSAQQPAKKNVSFINDVAPILKESCFACHDARKRKGKFDMTTWANFRKGGRSEIDPVEPGKVEESYILDLLKAKDASRMPPRDSGDAVSAKKIAVIEQWIREGAKLDKEIKPDASLLRELRVRWQPPAAPAKYKYPALITALAFTPDSKQVVAGGQHELTVWDIVSKKLVKRIHTRAERAFDMEFLPDGKLIVAGGRPGQEGDVRVYDLNGKATMKDGIAMLDGVNDRSVFLTQLLEADDSVRCIDVSKDGKRLVSGGTDRLVHVWDLSAGITKAKELQTIENHADWVFDVKLADDGKHLLTCSRDKTAKVWDLSAKQSVMTFPDHQNPAYGVSISPDSKIGYSVGEDNQLRSWNVGGNRKQIRAARAHGATIFKVVHHPSQPLLATCSSDKTVKILNSANLAATKTLSGHADWVYEITFSPDGKLLASAGYDGEIRIWNVADGKLVSNFNGSPFLVTAK